MLCTVYFIFYIYLCHSSEFIKYSGRRDYSDYIKWRLLQHHKIYSRITFALSNTCCTHVKSERNIIVSHRHCLCVVCAQWKGGWEILNSMLLKKSIAQDCYLILLHHSCRKQRHNETRMYIRVTRKWIAGFKKSVFERSSFRKAPLKWHMRWQDIFKNTTKLWPAFTGCFFPPSPILLLLNICSP